MPGDDDDDGGTHTTPPFVPGFERPEREEFEKGDRHSEPPPGPPPDREPPSRDDE